MTTESESVCAYCGTQRGGKMSCCGECHFEESIPAGGAKTRTPLQPANADDQKVYQQIADNFQAQATQEPVAWLHADPHRLDTVHDKVRSVWLGAKPEHVEHYTIPLYTRPAPLADRAAPFIPTCEWPADFGEDFSRPEDETDVAVAMALWMKAGESECVDGIYTEFYRMCRQRFATPLTAVIFQSEIFAALMEICNRIERCGASPELTNAIMLASDLRMAIGNELNRPDKYAAQRVTAQLNATTPTPPAAPTGEIEPCQENSPPTFSEAFSMQIDVLARLDAIGRILSTRYPTLVEENRDFIAAQRAKEGE